MHIPGVFETILLPYAAVSLTPTLSVEDRRWDGWKRSSISAVHCCYFPKRQRINTHERMHACISVNQAPLGASVSTAERSAPSKEPKTRKKKIMMRMMKRHTSIATRETRQVVINVTKMT